MAPQALMTAVKSRTFVMMGIGRLRGRVFDFIIDKLFEAPLARPGQARTKNSGYQGHWRRSRQQGSVGGDAGSVPSHSDR